MKDKSKIKRARGKGDVKEQFLIRSRLKGSPVINFDLYYKLKIDVLYYNN